MSKKVFICLLTLTIFVASFYNPSIGKVYAQNAVVLSRFGAGNAIRMFVGDKKALVGDYSFGWTHNWSLTEGSNNNLPSRVDFAGLVGGYNPNMASCSESVKNKISNFKDGSYIWIGNEIGLDDKSDPTTYAKKYKSWYDCIKSVNPSINVAVGANPGNPNTYYSPNDISKWVVSNDSMGRWDTSSKINYYTYLNLVNQEYNRLYKKDIPRDFYVIHIYPIEGGWYNTDTIFNFVIDFRKYMKSMGHQNYDLFIKEMGFLDPALNDQTKMNHTMVTLLDKLLNTKSKEYGNLYDDGRLVQRWAWFIASSWPNSAGKEKWEQSSFMVCPSIPKSRWSIDCSSKSSYQTPLGLAYVNYISSIKNSYDTQRPEAPTVQFLGKIGNSYSFKFFAQDPGGKIDNYAYSIGTKSGVADIKIWKNVGKTTKVTFLTNQNSFYLNVKARDDGFNWSEIGSFYFSKYDTNKDGLVDIKDALEILKSLFK